MASIRAALCITAVASLAPAPQKPLTFARRDIAATLGAGIAAIALPALADEVAAPPAEAEAPAPVEFPKDWGITSDYYTDAAKVVAHMRLATSLEKGAPNMELIALNCKKEMIDFVRRGAEISHGLHAIDDIVLTGRFTHRCRSTAASRT